MTLQLNKTNKLSNFSIPRKLSSKRIMRGGAKGAKGAKGASGFTSLLKLFRRNKGSGTDAGADAGADAGGPLNNTSTSTNSSNIVVAQSTNGSNVNNTRIRSIINAQSTELSEIYVLIENIDILILEEEKKLDLTSKLLIFENKRQKEINERTQSLMSEYSILLSDSNNPFSEF